MTLRLCCFGWKSLPEMLFQKWGCLVGPKNSIFWKLKSVDPKKSLWPRKCFYTSFFPSKHFRKMREREREREHARAHERRRSSPRSRAPAPVRDRDRRRDLAVDRDLAFAISRCRSRSREEGEIVIAPSIAISDRDRTAVVELETFSSLMIFFFFSGLWLVFSDLCFPSSFPNTRKYFLESFLKRNQTHGNIFIFRKLAFPENMYFPENDLQQPNTALKFYFSKKLRL